MSLSKLPPAPARRSSPPLSFAEGSVAGGEFSRGREQVLGRMASQPQPQHPNGYAGTKRKRDLADEEPDELEDGEIVEGQGRLVTPPRQSPRDVRLTKSKKRRLRKGPRRAADASNNTASAGAGKAKGKGKEHDRPTVNSTNPTFQFPNITITLSPHNNYQGGSGLQSASLDSSDIADTFTPQATESVFYADGSARPELNPSNGPSSSDSDVTSTHLYHGGAAWACAPNSVDWEGESEVLGLTSSLDAELHAILLVLQHVSNNTFKDKPIIVIRTDCEGALKQILKACRDRNNVGSTLVRNILALLDVLDSRGNAVKML